MLKVNVGLSRKVTRDFNSTGFSLNLEGEICGTLDDPETLIERIKEYYDLADERLHRLQESRMRNVAAIRHDSWEWSSQGFKLILLTCDNLP